MIKYILKGYIYKISNTVNEKLYIGLTIRTIQERWKQHIDSSNSPNDKSYNYKIHCAMRELGIENFHVEQIEEVTAESERELWQKLGRLERYWIAKYDSFKNGYNGSEGGESLPRPVKARNISTGEIAHYPSAREAARQTDVNNSHITECCKGKCKTLRNSNGDIYQFAYEDEDFSSLENYNDGRARPVKAKNIETSEITYYPSTAEAERQTGINNGNIIKCCKGKHKTAGNSNGDIYQFAYEDEEFPSLENYNGKRPVKARNIEKSETAHYPSAHEAARQTGVNQGNITKCCKGRCKTLRNSNGDIYQFAYEDEDFSSLENYDNKRPRAVIATDLATGVETEYPSAHEAARQTGISQSNITACCKGRRKTAGGKHWRYKYPQ